MKCGRRKHFAFQLVATPNLSTNTNIIKFCIFTIKKTMEYKEEFKEQNIWVDRIKTFLLANEENKEILFKLLPNIFTEITNFNDIKPKKRVLSNRKKPKQ